MGAPLIECPRCDATGLVSVTTEWLNNDGSHHHETTRTTPCALCRGSGYASWAEPMSGGGVGEGTWQTIDGFIRGDGTVEPL